MAELSFYTASAPDEKIEMKVYSASDIHLDKDRAKVAKMIDGGAFNLLYLGYERCECDF